MKEDSVAAHSPLPQVRSDACYCCRDRGCESGCRCSEEGVEFVPRSEVDKVLDGLITRIKATYFYGPSNIGIERDMAIKVRDTIIEIVEQARDESEGQDA